MASQFDAFMKGHRRIGDWANVFNSDMVSKEKRLPDDDEKCTYLMANSTST